MTRNLVLLKHKDLFYTACAIYKSSGFCVPLAGTAKCSHNFLSSRLHMAGKFSIMLEHNAINLVKVERVAQIVGQPFRPIYFN